MSQDENISPNLRTGSLQTGHHHHHHHHHHVVFKDEVELQLNANHLEPQKSTQLLQPKNPTLSNSSNLSKIELNKDDSAETDLRNLNELKIHKNDISPNDTVATDHIYRWGNSHPKHYFDKVLTLDELSTMSQAELIAQVLTAQKTIEALQNPKLEFLVPTSDHLKDHQLPKHIDLPNLTVKIHSADPELPKIPGQTETDPAPFINMTSLEEPVIKTPSDLHLIESPLIRTPPYEYIVLTKENEPKFRIYLNPRMDKVFRQEISNLKLSQSMALNTGPTPSQSIPLNTGPTPTGLISERVFGSSSGVIHCFDPSDVDLELKKLLLEKAPLTHRIVRRKPRIERGSSVPAIDSYYGTKDLAMVGHASYFIPMLTSAERKALGWKDEYRYGKWKYSSPNIRSTTSGHIPLRPVQSSKINKPSSKHQNNNHQNILQSQSKESSGQIETNPTDFITSESGHKIMSNSHSPRITDFTQAELKSLKEEEEPTGEVLMEPKPSRHVLKDKRSLKKFLRWIVPCIKSKKSSLQDDENDTSSSSSDSDEDDEVAVKGQGQLIEGTVTKVNGDQPASRSSHSHNHHHHHHGCFGFRHSHRTKVTGGDVIDSSEGSLVSVPNKPAVEIVDVKVVDVEVYKEGDGVTIADLSNDDVEVVFEVSDFVEEEPAPGIVPLEMECQIRDEAVGTLEIPRISVSEISGDEESLEIQADYLEIEDFQTNLMDPELTKSVSTFSENWSTKAENDFEDCDDGLSLHSNGYLTDAMLTSHNPGFEIPGTINTHYVGIDPFADVNYIDEDDEDEEESYLYWCSHSMPEPRFLFPDHEARLAQCSSVNLPFDFSFENEDISDYDEGYPDDEDYTNYIPSEDDEDETNAASMTGQSGSPTSAIKAFNSANNNGSNPYFDE